MVFFRCFLFLFASHCVLLPAAAESPRLSIRLHAGLSTEVMEVGDSIEGVVIAPAHYEGEVIVPFGWTVRGSITTLERWKRRHHLKLDFVELVHPGGRIVSVETTLSEVDNARESVDSGGFLHTLPPAGVQPRRLVPILAASLASEPRILSTLGGIQLARTVFSNPSIIYPAGVEMDLAIVDPEAVRDAFLEPVMPSVPEISEGNELTQLARFPPYQTFSMRMDRPADLVNVILVGTETSVADAFEEAGWVTADAMNLVSRAKLAFAFTRHRSYRRAPMSRLVLEGESPVMALQKGNNTVAKRHHIRIYRSPWAFDGRPVWYGAATHDVAIEYSYERGKFIHRIDSDIDKERGKIVNDLLFTGRVEAKALVERPDAPKLTTTASGVAMRTDGRVAILLLGGAPMKETQSVRDGRSGYRPGFLSE